MNLQRRKPARSAVAFPLRVMYLDHTAKWSGGEIALLRTLEALDTAVVQPIVVLAEEGEFAVRLRAAGIETLVEPLGEAVREVRKDTLGAAGMARQGGTGLRLLRYAIRVARLARRNGVALIHANSLKSDLYAAAAGRMARVPVLWHVRDHISAPYLPPTAAKLFRRLAQTLPQYVVANSHSTLETLFPQDAAARVAAGRAFVLYDGLPLEMLESGAAAATLRRAGFSIPPRIGIVGRIVAWKGQHVFLEAAAKVRAAGFAARYSIIGGAMFGEQGYEAELHEQAKRLGIADDVEFLGFRSDVPDLLKRLDILVHASTTPEPFGQVVIEGMAAGLPVIASDGGGVREIIRENATGLRTPMGDADALAEAICALLSDAPRAHGLGAAGLAHVRAHFTAEQSARGLADAYCKILAVSLPHTLSFVTEKGIQ